MNIRYIVRAIAPLGIILLFMGTVFVGYQHERSVYLKGEADYDLTYRFRVENRGNVNLTSLSVRLALLKTWEHVQSVDSLKIGTTPNRTSTDDYENEFVHYEYDQFAAGAQLDLEFDAKLSVHLIDYSTYEPKTNSYQDTPKFQLYSTYDSQTDPTDPRIIQTASNILPQTDNILDEAFALYNFTASYLNYRLLSTSRGASFALSNGYGDCDEYQNLFIALSQAAGIPAVGHTAWFAEFEAGKTYTDQGSVAHAYPMILVPEVGLLPADPTRGKDNLYDNWLKTDYKRITLTRGPDHPYRLLNYRWVPDTVFGDPVISSNYTIEIHNLDINYFSTIRNSLLASLFVFPGIFVIYNLIQGYKVRKNREKKLQKLLSPTINAHNDELRDGI